jgi:hypothetical protein
MPTVTDKLPVIMQLTREMLGKAEAGAWDDLIDLETRRASMIKQYFDAIRDTGVNASDAACVRELRELNGRILEHGKARRQQLMRLLSERNHQRRAVTCYRQTGAG